MKRSGKRSLLSSVGYRARRLAARGQSIAERFVRPLALRWPWAASVYYATVNNDFRREHFTFLQGREKYRQLEASPTSGFALLRRNTHRLEKGLLMQPRRDVFAKEYIGETVECYQRSVEAFQAECADCEKPSDELLWARDVLSNYFAVTGSDPVLDAARQQFRKISDISDRESTFVPYCRDFENTPGITIDQFEHLAKHRRSVRWFLDQPVERTLIDRAIQVAAQAPSACNRQPFQFRIFDQPDLVRQVAAVPMGTGGYAHNIPVMIVIVGQQRNYFAERDRHLIYIDGSLAAMSFVLAAEVQGLSTCCINWPDIELKEREMADLIGLAADERPIMCLAVGYPDPEGKVAFSQKKDLDTLRSYNQKC